MVKKRKKARELIWELNKLDSEVWRHTNLETHRYTFQNPMYHVWCLLVVFMACIACVFAWMGLLFFAGMVETRRFDDLSVPTLACLGIACLAAVGCLWSRAKARNAYPSGVIVDWMSRRVLKELRQELDERKAALAEYEKAFEETRPLARKFWALSEVENVDEVLSDLEVKREKEPFKVSGKILDDDFEYPLTEESYEKLVFRLACTYYGRYRVADFRKLLESQS